MAEQIEQRATEPLLSVHDVHVFYGESHVVRGVSLNVREGKVLNLLGRNGVGKTTLVKSIIGILRPRSGQILLKGERIDGKRPYEIARKGIMYVPQGREIFARLTVEENLKAGAIGRGRKIPEIIYEYFPFLEKRLRQKGGTLSGGEQQMLAIARALAGQPKVLLLDEPTEGIQPSIVKNISFIVCNISDELNISVLLVEQNIEFACSVTHDCVIMEKGEFVYRGAVHGAEDQVCETHMLA